MEHLLGPSGCGNGRCVDGLGFDSWRVRFLFPFFFIVFCFYKCYNVRKSAVNVAYVWRAEWGLGGGQSFPKVP